MRQVVLGGETHAQAPQTSVPHLERRVRPYQRTPGPRPMTRSASKLHNSNRRENP